jgi:hypothetical protein
MRGVAVVTLVGHMQAGSDTEAYDKAHALIDDIIGAIHVDASRGGHAIDTKVIDEEDSASDPDRFPDHQGGTVSVVVRCEVTFRRPTTVTP